MGVQMLHKDDVQILFVDLQAALVAGSQTIKPKALATAAGVLANVAKILNIPMTFSVVPEQGQQGKVLPELAEYASDANTLPRVVAGPFMEPSIVGKLASHRRRVLVIAAFSAEVAGLQSTLGAIEAGYAVHIPVDTIGSRSERTEAAVLRQMERAGALPTCVLSLATMLAPDFSKEPGKQVLAALSILRSGD